MTDLTEKWRKGELPEGYYYVKDGENMIAEYLDGYFYNNGEPMTSFSGGVDSVLAEVPSYEEWQAKLEENAQLKVIKEKTYNYDYLSECYSKFIKENAQLKELLKECRRQFEEVELCRYDVTDTDQEDWLKISTEQASIANKMITKIDEVLK